MKYLFVISSFFILTFHSLGQTFDVSRVETSFDGNVFSPAFWKDSLIVCSDQKDRVLSTTYDKVGNEPIDLYLINPQKPNSFIRFDKHFRTKFHDGPISFSEDGKTAAVSRNLKTDQKLKNFLNDENHLGIYFSSNIEGEWSELVPFTQNDTAYNCTHPALSADGNILIFSSNMPGGEGGFDLWRSEFINNSWSKAQNLGPTVNSKNDEVFPSINSEGIYFSSNRPGLGGLDLYSSSRLPTTVATLLDSSINSSSDDFGLISKEELKQGYYSSNRNGQDELFKFTFEYPEFNECDSIVETYFCYTLRDEYAIDLASTSTLVYEWNVNGEKIRGIEVDYCFENEGDYEITLDIIDTVINQVFYEQSYIFLSIHSEIQPYITAPDTVQINETFALSADQSNLPDLEIADEDYFWLINGKDRYRGKNVNHTFQADGIYEIQLGVIGTSEGQKIQDCVYRTIICGNILDTTQNSEYTNLLDQKSLDLSYNIDLKKEENFYADPLDSLTYYTVEIAKEKAELASNDFRLKFIEGKYDYKLKYIEEEDVYIYIVGEFENVEEAHEFWKELKQLGLEYAIVRTILEDEGSISLEEMFVLNNVQFDVDSYKIRNEALPDLDLVLDVLKTVPDVRLEVRAHTDNSHDEDYNLKLSIRRANSIKNHLVSKGINEARIDAIGIGEAQPKASNQTKQGKQLNRRVEFQIISN